MSTEEDESEGNFSYNYTDTLKRTTQIRLSYTFHPRTSAFVSVWSFLKQINFPSHLALHHFSFLFVNQKKKERNETKKFTKKERDKTKSNKVPFTNNIENKIKKISLGEKIKNKLKNRWRKIFYKT